MNEVNINKERSSLKSNSYTKKRYSNKTETVLVDKKVVSHYRTKTKKSKILITTYQSSSNHKIIQISEMFFDYYEQDYKYSKKNISIPIKDFKMILKQLNDVI